MEGDFTQGVLYIRNSTDGGGTTGGKANTHYKMRKTP